MGFATNDDAGIYRLTEDIALVTTADFITPPVDDPFVFGQVAAANALSDVYAMGGRPITALNLVGLPSDQLPLEVLQRIVAGALVTAGDPGDPVGSYVPDAAAPTYQTNIWGNTDGDVFQFGDGSGSAGT